MSACGWHPAPSSNCSGCSSTLDRYALGRADVDHEELLTRFEIFWSRLPLLVEGDDSASIQSVEGAATVPQMIAQLERLEPAVMALRPGDRAAYRPISDTPARASPRPCSRSRVTSRPAVGLNSDAQRARSEGCTWSSSATCSAF